MRWKSKEDLPDNSIHDRRRFAWLPTPLWPGPGPYGSGGIVVWFEHYWVRARYISSAEAWGGHWWDVIARRATREELDEVRKLP
jgi:hypothetical protein